MPIAPAPRRAPLTATPALAGALALTACGELRASGGPAGTAAGASGGPSPSPLSSSPSSSPAAGASPWVEPGAGDGAPYHDENNACRRPGETPWSGPARTAPGSAAP
ncbi:hypothetical protein SUDANB108_06430 [Streptomyces sp. enrichment culture]|uniref:hypothetical protein n=1 Tax=Streptomyces sp. enrichment culture TaxID=1795815 RepID=UPI003F550587